MGRVRFARSEPEGLTDFYSGKLVRFGEDAVVVDVVRNDLPEAYHGRGITEALYPALRQHFGRRLLSSPLHPRPSKYLNQPVSTFGTSSRRPKSRDLTRNWIGTRSTRTRDRSSATKEIDVAMASNVSSYLRYTVFSQLDAFDGEAVGRLLQASPISTPKPTNMRSGCSNPTDTASATNAEDLGDLAEEAANKA